MTQDVSWRKKARCDSFPTGLGRRVGFFRKKNGLSLVLLQNRQTPEAERETGSRSGSHFFFCCCHPTLLRQSIDLKEMGFTTWRGSTRYRRWFKRRANVLPARASGLQWWNVCQELTDTGVGWMFAVHLSGGSICWKLKCDCFNSKADS